MSLLRISHYTLSSALGHGRAAQWQALHSGQTGLRQTPFDTSAIQCHVGEVRGLAALPSSLREFDCRNHRLAWLGLQQDGFAHAATRLRERHGASRIGVFMGTSTAGIHSAELAYRELNSNAVPASPAQEPRPLAAPYSLLPRAGEGGPQGRMREETASSRAQFAATLVVRSLPQAGEGRERASTALPDWFDYRHTQNLFSVADFVAHALQLGGPVLVISTACSSSAKVFAAAYRHIQMGLCDAAIVGGVDSLCLTTLYGFNSLQLVSNDLCRPADAQRKGISIGEAAGFAILEKPDACAADALPYALLGYGESGDAYHMSSPDPQGHGAAAAMQLALQRAQVAPEQVDYINLHGTGTQANDAAEDKGVLSVFGTHTPCSSTKGWTGHTLGAAGIMEAGIAMLCIEHGFMPQSLNTQVKDPALQANILMQSRNAPVQRVLSNSFGFGGSNCSLLIGAEP